MPSPLQPLDILLVDDRPELSEPLGMLLEMDGHRVRVAASGAEALALIEQSCPDVVVTDVQMPGMDGRELGHRIRAGRHAHLVLIGLTGQGGQHDAIAAENEVFDHYLVKPAGLPQLYRILGAG